MELTDHYRNAADSHILDAIRSLRRLLLVFEEGEVYGDSEVEVREQIRTLILQLENVRQSMKEIPDAPGI